MSSMLSEFLDYERDEEKYGKMRYFNCTQVERALCKVKDNTKPK